MAVDNVQLTRKPGKKIHGMRSQLVRAAKREGLVDMGQIVKCDVCGKIYNESHLTTHKRRSHGKPEAPRLPGNGNATVEVVVSLYKGLTEDQKRQVRDRLIAADQTKL